MRKDNLRGFFGVALALAIIATLDMVKPTVSSAPDFSCSAGSGGSVNIEVSEGESGASIAANLAEKGVVKSSTVFFRLAVSDSRASSIAPGTHRIDRGLCASDALNQLLDAKRITNLIAINEGTWNSEIKVKLAKIGFSKSDIEAAFRKAIIPAGFNSLEGLLFPAQYSFDPKSPLPAILEAMIDRGLLEIKNSGISLGVDGFTKEELLIIASLIEAESDPVDYAKVSRVVRNRLKIGMPLQFDSTVHYIEQKRGSIFLSTKSTLLKSPYNTYRNYGLPPSPINNPGQAAMLASVNPDSGDWLYFITVAPGDTRFTSDFSQFNEWKVIYRKNLRSGKFE